MGPEVKGIKVVSIRSILAGRSSDAMFYKMKHHVLDHLKRLNAN